LEGFKCFADNEFRLSPLTVLAGRNASGKTSLLHALAVMRQTVCANGNFDSLEINGPIVRLGRAHDILHRTRSRIGLRMAFTTLDGVWARTYEAKTREDFRLTASSRQEDGNTDIAHIFRTLTYLSADRLGPREMHTLDDSTLYADVGVRGEKAIARLLALTNKPVREGLRIPDNTPNLLKQTEAHLRRIFPGFRLDAQPASGTNAAVLSLSSNEAIGFVRPQNIGFGLSYALPIYVACLSADAGDVILVENPEAHLHPGAQSLTGEFLASAAATGLQIIVETHSDHLLNGIRKSVKSPQGGISADDVAIFFFSGFGEDGILRISSPRITETGALDHWPDGFFDQYDRDLADLVEW
jgi:predicted ATPase